MAGKKNETMVNEEKKEVVKIKPFKKRSNSCYY